MDWTTARARAEELRDLVNGGATPAVEAAELLDSVQALVGDAPTAELPPGRVATLRRLGELLEAELRIGPLPVPPVADDAMRRFVSDLEGRRLTPGVGREVNEFIQDYLAEADALRADLDRESEAAQRGEQVLSLMRGFLELMDALVGHEEGALL